jgi:hypothetical protein
MGDVQSYTQPYPRVVCRRTLCGGGCGGEPRRQRAHGVAAQVEFERHILKPGLIFKGKGLKPLAFKLWVSIVQRAPPHHGVAEGRGGTR